MDLVGSDEPVKWEHGPLPVLGTERATSRMLEENIAGFCLLLLVLFRGLLD